MFRCAPETFRNSHHQLLNLIVDSVGMRPVTITLSIRAEASLSQLRRVSHEKHTLSLLRALDRACHLLSENPFVGQAVPRRLFPERLREQYDITTLYRLELPGFWRLLYTIRTRSEEITCTVLIIDLLNHKEYDKLFGYKKC